MARRLCSLPILALLGCRPAAAELEDRDALASSFETPAFIDSHVHLAYAFDAQTLADGGVAAAVDLGAPLSFLEQDHAPLQLRFAGPMLTAPGGYPTQSWGAGGYGLEVTGPRSASVAVDRLIDAGATVIKIPFDGEPSLDDATVKAIVDRAHAHGVEVAGHALGDPSARRARALGVDVLAHTPVEPLDDATIAQWSNGAVISTLSAFGGSPSTVDNLRRLHAAGCTVLYGTDLGNTRTPGIDATELALLAAAGLDGQAIVDAATTTPARFWGIELRPGDRVITDVDPREDPGALACPRAVYIDGVLRAPMRCRGGRLVERR